ncbi:hypothetical protein D3C73_660550 [compost metagenome]
MSELNEKTEKVGQTENKQPLKPFKVLSTSLGIMLAGHLILASTLLAADTAAVKPQLVEWSSDEVKAYFDSSLDWNLPLPKDQAGQPTASPAPEGSPIIINNGGFGWDDLLLYHMIFNMGSPYSSKSWSSKRPYYDVKTNKAYKPKTYDAGTFQNKPSTKTKTPNTSSGSGSFTTNKSSTNKSSNTTGSSTTSSSGSSSKSTSTSSGSIGSKSSGFSSSSSGG